MEAKVTGFNVDLLANRVTVSFGLDGGNIIVLVPLDTSGNKTESQFKAAGFELTKSALESAIVACKSPTEK